MKSARSKKPENQFLPVRKPFPVLWLALILGLTCIIYSGIYDYAVLNFDDIEYFTNYPEVLDLSWRHAGTYFTSHYVLMYQPLPVMTLAMNYAAGGMDPSGMHVVNVMLHCLNIILVYLFVYKLTEARAGSLLVALAFAIHPLNTEAVTWISARSSVMYTLFYLASLIMYIQYVRSEYKSRYLLLCMVLFLLSLFSKAQAVTLPVVLLLMDYFFSVKLSKRRLLEKIPFFALSIVFGLIALSDASTVDNITSGMLTEYSMGDIPFLVSWSYLFYIVKIIFPFSLCSIYVYPPHESGMLPPAYYISAVLIGALMLALWKARNNRLILFSAAFFLVTITLNIQLVPSRMFIVADRYAYVPALGIMMIPLFMQVRKPLISKNYYMIAALVFLFGYYAVYAYQRNRVWENDLTLMNDIIEKNPPTGYIYRAYGIRGLYYAGHGNPQAAVADFTRAMELNPGDPRTWVNRGLVYARSENNLEALSDFTHAIKLDSMQAHIYSYRAIVNYKLNKKEESLQDCNRCISLNPGFADCYITRSTVYYESGNVEGSLWDLSAALNLDSRNATALKNRGQVYLSTGRRNEACTDLNAARQLGNQEAEQLYGRYCMNNNIVN